MSDPIQFSIGPLEIIINRDGTINRDGQPPHISALNSTLCVSGTSFTIEFNDVRIIVDNDQLHIGVHGEETSYVRFFLSEIACIKKKMDLDRIPYLVRYRKKPDYSGEEPDALTFNLHGL